MYPALGIPKASIWSGEAKNRRDGDSLAGWSLLTGPRHWHLGKATAHVGEGGKHAVGTTLQICDNGPHWG
jgi:hypothetical protein